jgi:multicomponent K+:H+ antiporter subunit D
LSGFLGKLLILKASGDSANATVLWSFVLGGSLLAIIAVARAGSVVFWKATPRAADAPAIALPPLKVATVGILLAGIVAWTVFAAPIAGYADAAASAVLEPSGGAAVAQPDAMQLPTSGGLP